MEAILSALAVVVGAVLGFLGSVITEDRRNRAAAQRDSAARDEIRQQQRDDLQRQNLLELQEAVSKMVRSVGKAWLHDTSNYEKHKQFFQLGPELDQEEFQNRVALRHLQARVRDDDLRGLIEQMSEIGAEMGIPTTIHKLEADMERFRKIVEALDQKLGAVLRQYL
jgi:hypothetical protein